MSKFFKSLVIILILVAIIAGGYVYWQRSILYPSTDDAYVQAHIINIAPRISGNVTQVAVENHQYIKRGQLLFKIDPTTYQLAVAKAQANLDNTMQQVKGQYMAIAASKALVIQRQAELIEAQKNAKRILILVREKIYPPQKGDDVISKLNVAKAALEAATEQEHEAEEDLGKMGAANAKIKAASAMLSQAKLNLSYTTVTAPSDGYIENLSLQAGDQVNAYQNLFALIENNIWWVSANFKETQLERIKENQSASVVVDMYPNYHYEGRVVSISSGSGSSFTLLPPENASGNWVKVTQRFPVRIRILHPSNDYPLRLGASATVTINTRSSS